MKRIVFYNTVKDAYKGWSFYFLPFITIDKSAVWGYLCQYCLSIGWLCWAVSIVLKDESDNVKIEPLEDEE